MRNDLKDALHTYRRDGAAAAITTVILTPLFHYAATVTWLEAIGLAVAPLGIMLGVKLFIEGWFGPAADLDTDDAELVDVRVDRRGRLHGSWRRRPQE